MGMTFTLIEVTPHRLQYLGVVVAGEAGFTAHGTIPNPAPPGVGMSTDASQFNGSALFNLLNTGVTSQAAARTLIFGDGRTANIDIEKPRCKVTLNGRSTSIGMMVPWSIDANVSASRAVLDVRGPNIATQEVIIDIHYKHTRRR